MLTVVVYLKEDYSKNETIYLPADYDKNQIRDEVNRRFKIWYYYDIFKEMI